MASKKINKNEKIFIAGHLGMVGSAITRRLEKRGYNNLLTRTRKELDLLNQKAVFSFLNKEKPSREELGFSGSGTTYN